MRTKGCDFFAGTLIPACVGNTGQTLALKKTWGRRQYRQWGRQALHTCSSRVLTLRPPFDELRTNGERLEMIDKIRSC